ncbi:MAG: D-alanyl-D-alanine carboxypeptidase, partial [Oscillospiraceae bacterium]|nr:D-alanyl-D-alanine carboxypeptidase [Oscillospiraceae bacterium]
MKKTFVLFLMLVLTLCVGAQAASLPEGYTEVEYIESQGAGYIQTGWSTANVNSSYGYELTFEFDDAAPSVDSFMFGAYDTDADPYDFRMGAISADSNGTTRIAFGDTSSSNAAAVNWPSTTAKQTVKVDVAKNGSKWNWAVTKDGSTNGINNASGTVSTSPISDKEVWLFALSDGTLNGAYNRMGGKVYALKIWEDGETVRDYVPCYRVSDEVAGLYDLVGSKFYPGTYDMNITYPGQEKALGICNTGIVVNADTGEIYYGQHIDRRHGQASMTKIMTCILTVENVDVNERALVAIYMDHDDGSSMKLVTGEQHTIDDVLYGMMLPSGNDAAQLLARTVGTKLGGNFGTFVDMMNAKAHELGMINTVYESPQGGYQTTAYDYAKLCEYGMRNELFRKYAYESFWTIEADPEYNVVEHNLTNANQLMPGLPYEYEGITGIKPGSTQATRAHNAASATRVINGKEVNLITVIFGANENTSKHNRFTNCTAFLDYGFAKAEAEPYTVTAEGNKLTIYNPVSGYTVEAVISAADTAYTGEPIEAAVVDTTYTYGTWNPNWEIKYENNVEKGTATASITYDGQTASCTFEIVEPTVTLTEDTAVDTLVVP